MSLTRDETIAARPLLIRRDLGPLADLVSATRNLTRPQKIDLLAALTRLAADPDDSAGVETALKILGI